MSPARPALPIHPRPDRQPSQIGAHTLKGELSLLFLLRLKHGVWIPKETPVTEYRVIASVNFVEYRQFDLGPSVRNRSETNQADRIIRAVSIEAVWKHAERAGHRAASFPGEIQP